MINGLPGLMALETAKVCLERGFNLIPYGFTGPNCNITNLDVTGTSVKLIKGPGISTDASGFLKTLKESYPRMIIVDYTSPHAVLDNLHCYIENDCNFVMGTTGIEQSKIKEVFEYGKNIAVIAPNMAKQIVALQSTLLTMATRFPNSFSGYKLSVS
jgi:4-hydroxy-tetrahydrodipicolinate reductase